MRKTTALAALIMCVAASSALGARVWHWTLPYVVKDYVNPARGGADSGGVYFYLTTDNGSHAVAMAEYTDGEKKVWTSILSFRYNPDWSQGTERNGFIRAYEYKDIGSDPRHWVTSDSWPFDPHDPAGEDWLHAAHTNVANNADYKSYSWVNPADVPFGYGTNPPAGVSPDPNLTYQEDDWWETYHDFSAQDDDHMVDDEGVAVALFKGPDGSARRRGFAVWAADHYDTNDLRGAYTTDGGSRWLRGGHHIEKYYGEYPRWFGPSLATNDVGGETAYLAYVREDHDEHEILRDSIDFRRSVNWGEDWSSRKCLGVGSNPCIAAVGQFVFVCYLRMPDGGSIISYRYSTDGGDNWTPDLDSDPATVPFDFLGAARVQSANVAVVPCPTSDTLGVLIVATPKLTYNNAYTTRGWFLRFAGGTCIYSYSLMPLCSGFENAGPLSRPSVAAIRLSDDNPPAGPIAACVLTTPGYRGSSIRRSIRMCQGYWANRWPGSTPGANTARLLALDADGVKHYGSATWPYFAAGEVIGGWPVYSMAGTGDAPALAVDAGGWRWVAYIDQDTLWCYDGENEPMLVFAGSSSAVPGQSSVVCYPNQANGVYVANVVFAVYDTAGTASRIMYARVDTGGVVLDTIESVNTLRDSLPCINIYKSDTLLVTWQHGDSVLSKLLADYGPSTQGQPPAWSSANLVTASGYHPMSVMENGCVINCDYAQQSGGYSIRRATNDLGGGMFGNWVAMTSPSATSNVTKDAAAYAGVGSSVWQQQVSGKWVIKGFVRGAETTLVANDTDAYHPHAVAESSASSPSVDRIRLHLLYTAGVTFEVDSGVVDTGETRYSYFDYDVSNAGSDATRANNGCKLVRKEAGDSLYAAYQDADGTVMYAYSAAGDSWRREVLATERSYPAIAADSTGKRWVVAMTPEGTLPAAQYLYYQSGGSWASQSLYSGWDILGPASLAGASSTTTGIAYAAFKVTGMSSKYIVLAKFNGTTVAACTVATGANLGDPSVVVEAYKTDSDHVHVTWEDAGVVKYRMDTDGRSSGIANTWTSVVSLSDAQATSHHPAISADRDQIVAAWAQGATADIYYRKRSTSSAYNNWDAAVNLSNTANNASDWPTIAMGDTVVVGWEETRSAYDHDILVCINFGDTLNVADNATVSGYPHVLFYNKASGDTAIPYLHTIWSETPSASYYEVGYNKLNLKQSSGEGQQSASSTPIPTKPILTACRPNPFRDRTQINYALPTASNVSLRVYDATGRTVRTLASGHQRAGSYSVTWDSRDNQGRQVPRGVYFYRLDTPRFRSVKKAVVTR